MARRTFLSVAIAVLPRESEAGFQRLLAAINEDGALGAGCRALDLAIQKDHANLSLQCEGAALDVRLAPGREDAYFELVYDEEAWRDRMPVLERLSVTVQAAFESNPWTVRQQDEQRQHHEGPLEPFLPDMPSLPASRKLPVLGVWVALAMVLLVAVLRDRAPRGGAR